MERSKLLELIEKEFGIGCRMGCEERAKQIDKHGFTAEHHYNNDQWYENFQLQDAAHSMLAHELYEQAEVYDNLPQNWNAEWWERLCNKPREERLRIAQGLIAAELDRINFSK